MSGGGDNALLDLFREEVRANVQILNDGLVALEQDVTQLHDIEPLMRAAHSIKGAARVVNIDAAVAVAHAAEDCFVAAQEGRITLTGTDIDHLLNAADMLAGIAEAAGPHLEQWLAQCRGEIKQVATTLADRASGDSAGDAQLDAHQSATAERRTDTTGLSDGLKTEAQQAAVDREIDREIADSREDEPLADESVSRIRDAIVADQSQTFDESPMLDLFRSETETQVRRLTEGLAQLQKGSAGVEAVGPLLKAAQAIRSAGRVVDVGVAAEIGVAIEAALERVKTVGNVEHPDTLQALVELSESLTGIAGAVGPEYPNWLSEQAESLERVFAAVVHGQPAQGSEQDPPSAADDAEAEPLRSSASASEPSPRRAESSANAGADDQQTTSGRESRAASPPDRDTRPAAEQVVRVTAQSLTRLMALAGESLVEARWLQPFAQSLLELKRQQALLSDKLEQLRQWLPEAESGDRRTVLLAEASDRLDECRRMLAAQIGEFENRARNADNLNSRLYNEVIASRMRPFRDGVQGFPRMVRDLSRELGKQVTFRIHGEKTDVDRDILEKLDAPLNHILRNALDHGLERPDERQAAGKPPRGLLEIEARHNAGMLVITVRDDGRGIDLDKIRRRVAERGLADEQIVRELNDSELLEFLFLPAFSTADSVTEVSGRGVGLDVVHSMVQAVGGSVRILSQRGEGTTFRLELPITMSVIRAVLVQIAGEPYAFPHNRIDRLVRIPRNELHELQNRQYFEVDGVNVGIVRASQLLELEGTRGEQSVAGDQCDVILFSHLSDAYGLIVDEFCGERDLVVRPLDPRLGKVPDINAAAILDDGSPVLIVDLDDLRRSIERKLHHDAIGRAGTSVDREDTLAAKRVLVVDDSITVREVQRQLLSNQGYDVEVAVDGIEGWNALTRRAFDLVITDIDMPRLNGIEFVRRIKHDPQLRSIPVVIVSYKDRDEDRLRGMDAGADYYLTKSSFHDETLLEAVQDLIGAAH